MSSDDKAQKLRGMLDSGKLDAVTYRRLENDPVQSTQIIQNEEIRGALRDLHQGLFGNEKLQIDGALPRLKRLEMEFFRYKWMGMGMAALVSGIVVIIGMVIEANKH